jgi:hypothetical protein
MDEAHFTEELWSDLYCYAKEDLTPEAYPLSYQTLGEAQAKDKQIVKILQKKHSKYHLKSFHGGGKSRELICYKDKIVVPPSQQIRIIEWSHNYLGHPGINRREETIGQHLWWLNMRKHTILSVSTCDFCQQKKRRHKKYGHLPEKDAKAMPWDKMYIDLIGPYKIHRTGKKDPLICKCATMINPATGWFEIHQYEDK